MSLFNWPFTRKSYAGIENPIYVSDTQAATEAAIQSVKALAGLNDTDFAIITGLDYTAGVPNTYTSGIYYLNGVFYYQQAVFDEGFYLFHKYYHILKKQLNVYLICMYNVQMYLPP